jgi:hypothetical protein
VNILIWDRYFELGVEYNCYKGESVLMKQEEALDNFVSHPEWISKAKKYVEDFCRERLMEDKGNQKKDNIFSYVKPEYLFVEHDNETPRIALMCKCRYELEHGLAVVFSTDGDVDVGIQDIIL